MAEVWDRAVDLAVDAPPFERNPSAWNQRIPICILAGLGCVISTYMALYQWNLIDSVWDPVFGGQTTAVLSSDLSHDMQRRIRIPDAALGAWGYLSEAILGLAGSTRRWQFRPWMVIVFGIDVIPLGGVSAILVVAQGAVVGSWCFLCLVSALISFVLIALAYDEVWACLKYLRRVWTRHRDPRLLWRVFCGRPDARAELVALDRS